MDGVVACVGWKGRTGVEGGGGGGKEGVVSDMGCGC